MSNDTIDINLDDCVSAEDALVIIDLMVKGYTPQQRLPTIEYWNYELQSAMKVRDGKLWIKSKESSGWDETDVESLPDALEYSIDHTLGNDGKVVR